MRTFVLLIAFLCLSACDDTSDSQDQGAEVIDAGAD